MFKNEAMGLISEQEETSLLLDVSESARSIRAIKIPGNLSIILKCNVAIR